ncbi:MAG: hypothetical protein QM749_06560 [Aquabacterium sp.]
MSAVPLPSYAMWAGNWDDAPNRVDLQTGSNNVRIGSSLDAEYWGVTNIAQLLPNRETDHNEYLTLKDELGNPKPVLELVGNTLAGGKVTMSFKAKFDANAVITHTWRKSRCRMVDRGPAGEFRW